MSMFPPWARIGERVVYDENVGDPENGKAFDFHFELTHNVIYTIRDLLWSPYFKEPYILVAEARNQPRMWIDNTIPYEWGYLLRYFHPLVNEEAEKDVRLFKDIADNVDAGTKLDLLQEALNQ